MIDPGILPCGSLCSLGLKSFGKSARKQAYFLVSKTKLVHPPQLSFIK